MESYDSSDFTTIGEELFQKTINSMKLSVNPADQLKQRKLYESFRDGKAPDIKQQKMIQY